MRAFFVFIFFLSGIAAHASEQTESLCGKYLAFDDVLQCNRTGYLVDFGYRYCRRFEKTEHRYSRNGQLVLQKLRSCFIESLEESRGVTCNNVESTALGTHVGCYIENGFCSLSMKDKLRIVWTVKAEIRKRPFRKTMREILHECGLQLSSHAY